MKMSSLSRAIVDALPERVKQGSWTLLEHPLFTTEEWCGMELITPRVVLTPDEKARLREIFANHVGVADWMFGYNELRFTDYVNRDKYAR